MSIARLVITAVVLEGRTHTEVGRDYGISKGWVSKLVARYRIEGQPEFKHHPGHPATPRVQSRLAIALIVAGLLLLVVPLLLAGSSSRNGYYSCAEYEPASMSFSDTVVQTKHRVTLFPLVLECSFTTEFGLASPDYVVVEHDLGTGWWIGAPASFLAAAALWAVSRKRAALTDSRQA